MFLRTAEMAKALSISERQLRNWQMKRYVSFVKIDGVTLFHPATVEAEVLKFQRLHVPSIKGQRKVAKATQDGEGLN
jgi:hypothetical protein